MSLVTSTANLEWITAIAVLIALAGIWLLKIGRWPRRRGSERHCRRCEYNLSGLSSDKCPECGAQLSERNVVIGERRRRAGVAWVGVMLLISSLMGLGMAWRGPLARVDWYRYKLSRWVAADLRSSDDAVVARAWNELERRRREGPLSDAVEYAAAEAALAEQAKLKGQHGPLVNSKVDYLSRRAAGRRLAPGQIDRFFRQAMTADFKVRPLVVSAEEVWVMTSNVGTGPKGDGWWTEVYFGPLSAGINKRDGGGAVVSDGIGRQSAMLTYVAAPSPGPQEVTFVLPVRIYRGDSGYKRRSELFAQFDTILKASIDVESEPNEKNPRIRRRPELAEAIARCTKTEVTRRGYDSCVYLDFRLPPENLAFDISLNVDGKAFPLDRSRSEAVVCRKGEWKGSFAYFDGRIISKTKQVDVILRSSGVMARRTPDIFEIWDGEIVLRDVPIRDEK
jgi:hypothetical protein